MKKVLVISNHKGGVGKTTTAAAIATALASSGQRVLMIDLDAQCNLTDMFIRGYDGRTIYEALYDRHGLPIVQVPGNAFLNIAPSSEDMIAADIDFSGRTRREAMLKELIDKEAKDFDFIVIDTPPSLGILTIMALYAGTSLIVPTMAEMFSVNGLQRLLKAVDNVNSNFGASIKLAGILITRIEGTSAHGYCEEQLRQYYGDKVFTTKIRKNTKVVDSQLACQNLFDYAPKSAAAQDYKNLLQELLTRI